MREPDSTGYELALEIGHHNQQVICEPHARLSAFEIGHQTQQVQPKTTRHTRKLAFLVSDFRVEPPKPVCMSAFAQRDQTQEVMREPHARLLAFEIGNQTQQAQPKNDDAYPKISISSLGFQGWTS